MHSPDKNLSPEREETDQCLQAEREKADEALAKRAAAVLSEADQVVELARVRADSVLALARQKADATLLQGEGPSAIVQALSITRASEDAAVTEERVAADERLAVERAKKKHAFKLLLMLEREETDERLQLERERSDHAVASRDDFLAMVSHDVRGILTGIALSTELLIKMSLEVPGGERTQVEAQRIRRLTGRMNRLIGDLIDVVSMESGKLTVVATQGDARELLTETIESFQLTATARKILMTSAVSSEPLVASFDHERILQVLSNLVGNALKFTPAGGEIALSLVPSPGGIRFTVRDSGCGIAADQLEPIFERFSQAAQKDRRGLGLGLYIARCIIQAHGGKIWAESEQGKGSTFQFTIPVAAS